MYVYIYIYIYVHTHLISIQARPPAPPARTPPRRAPARRWATPPGRPPKYILVYSGYIFKQLKIIRLNECNSNTELN